jgi:ABC-2 type transport system permease protein
MIQIFLKEFFGFLHQLVAYIVIIVFLVGIGLPTWVFPETSVLDYGYADLGTLFSSGPYLLMFLAPAITMRSFAEERKMGTLEFLYTHPVSDLQILSGKFLAAWALALVALLPTVTYYFSLHALGTPPGNLDTPGIIGSYVGLALLAGLFSSIGIFASTITPNQVVSFLVAAILCFITYTGFDSVATLDIWGNSGLTVRQLGIYYHYESLGRGLIDSRDLVYFFTTGGIFLIGASTIMASRKW